MIIETVNHVETESQTGTGRQTAKNARTGTRECTETEQIFIQWQM
jgi:hypothetical protein